jgi:hypothetical protein
MAVTQLPSDRGRVQAGGNLRWLMVFMAFLGTTINYIDRANLGVAVPFIRCLLLPVHRGKDRAAATHGEDRGRGSPGSLMMCSGNRQLPVPAPV